MSNRVLGAKPFQISADDAAKRIAAGLERRDAVIAFPFLLAVGARLGNLLPMRLRRALLPSFRIKQANDR
jgi:hypothetical protein